MRKKRKKLLRSRRRKASALATGLFVLMLPILPFGFTNSIVPDGANLVSRLAFARDINKFRPAECNALTLTTLIVANNAGATAGTAGNDLIIASKTPTGKTLNAGAGDDCVVGNNATTTINGEAGGADICVKGATDTANIAILSGCETIANV